ncbi:MAG: SDR family oxidoreductase [Porticoccaceae bacterium]|nr:SDR family oxidoreductase [Porticoccaceae bacterium]
MAKVLIVGCGDIGLGLVEVLIAEGHEVSGIKRAPLAKDVPGLKLILADITVEDELNKLPSDFDQVFFILTPGAREEQSYRHIYLQGINNILAYFADAEREPHCLFVSSTSVYGQNAGEWVDEDSATDPSSQTAKVLLQAEKNILKAGASNTIVRFSGIYGPGREGMIKRVQSAVPVQYDPPYYTNRIHRDDCVGVLAYLFAMRLKGAALENTYLASDVDPAPLGDIVDYLAEKLNCPIPPPKSELEQTLSQNKRCSNKRLNDLGYSFRFLSYRDGYRLLLH